MARSLGNMVIHLGLDSRGMVTGARQAESSIASLSSRVTSALAAAATAFAAFTATRVGGWGVRLAAEAETAQAAFTVLVGSAELAASTLADLRKFAAESPFTFSGLQGNARTLLAFGVAAEEILPTMKMLGDISGGNAQRLDMLSLAFAQMTAAGRLMGQDLLQMVNAGFNPLQEISEATGISLADLKKKMEEGAITSDMVKAAFQRATQEGGKFHGMADNISKTLSGRWTQLIGQVELLAMKFGNELLPVLGRGIDMLTELAKWMNGLDASFVQNTIRVAAMGAAFVATMAIVPKIITLIGMLVKAYKALTMAQVLQQALSGPKGWATLAISLGVAASAGYAVTEMFSEQTKQISDYAVKAEKTVKAADDMAGAFDALSDSAGNAERELDALRQKGERLTESLKTPVEQYADAVAEANQLWAEGIITQETFGRALAKARDTLLESVDAAKELRNVNMNVGAAERFTSQGFSASQSTRLQELVQRDAQDRHKQHDRTNDLLAEGNRLAKDKTAVTLKKVTL